jgi:predicted 3-demethylubiquinone-9 3-methyltransferase (glyoxalase superfamily)
MQKITPYLWFDDQAEEAANFYTSIFKNSKIGDVTRYSEASAEVSRIPEGSVMTLTFQIEGQEFVGLNGGPAFNFTPAISFFVSCESEDEIDDLWGKLSDGGEMLMPLDHYPFSEKFGWLNDRFGVSWQLNLAASTQKITPFLMFVGDQHGKAEEAMNLYTSLFENSSIGGIERYGEGLEEPEGTVMHARFTLAGQEFMAMDSSIKHAFSFTEATSFLVSCKSQEEVDELWEKLTEGGEEQPCGWLKDKYGVSWQIIPTALLDMLSDPDPEKSERVTKAMLQMRKIEVEGLKKAYEGE